MLLREMTPGECRKGLSEATFGRLACARAGQPYIVPVSFIFDGEHLYSVSLPGQKIEWMRENPLVCLEVDKVHGIDDWSSIVVTGRFEELSSASERSSNLQRAEQMLRDRTMWWQPAATNVTGRPKESQLPIVFYRISMIRLTGRHASPDPFEGVP